MGFANSAEFKVSLQQSKELWESWGASEAATGLRNQSVGAAGNSSTLFSEYHQKLLMAGHVTLLFVSLQRTL